MTRDEALDLLPLLAGGELDEMTAAAAQRAAEEDPTLMAELESYRALDAALTTAYAPEPAVAVVEPQVVVVRRRCPYCHDAIEAEALVVCAACATPHHAPCFEANEGCSLLGCGSSASIAASGPASVVCQGCARNTPQGAPFCAWCGADVEAAAPRHARPRPGAGDEAPFDWRRHAAAAALLLVSTFGVGGLFGVQQAGVMEEAAVQTAMRRSERRAEAFERIVDEVTALQALQQPRLPARSLDDLRRLRAGAPADEGIVRRLDRLERALAEVSPRFAVTLEGPVAMVTLGLQVPELPPFALVFRPRDGRGPSVVVDSDGAAVAVQGAFTLDPMTLALRPAAGTTVNPCDWRTLWTSR